MEDCKIMFVSVVCPIYNEEKYIEKCIDSILLQDYPKERMEVLFVDGMSTDKTREIIKLYSEKYAFIKLLDNPQKIVPFAMNIGIKAAIGDFIIRLDAHAFFPENYFSELIHFMKELRADNVGGVCRTLPANNTLTCKSIADVLSCSFGMGNSYFRIGAKEIMKVDTVPFGCFKKELFERIGDFDEDLVRNQDDEFNGRIIKNGGKIFLLPHLVIDYFARDQISKLRKMFYQYGLFKPLVNKKLGSPATLRQFFPFFFVIGIILGPFFSYFSVVLLYVYVCVLLIYTVTATIFSIKNSQSVKEVLLKDYIYFVVHFSYGWGYLIGLFKLIVGKTNKIESNR